MRSLCTILMGASLAIAQDTATVTGKVRDITGAGVGGTRVELWLEGSRMSKVNAIADPAGVYHFSGLAAGTYTLNLLCPGFHLLTLKSIQISVGEQKELPALQLEVGSVADCGGHGSRESIRLLASGNDGGNLTGSVRVDGEETMAESPPVAGADVRLICVTGKVCGTTKTDSQGSFRFDSVPPGAYSVAISRAGFYPLKEPGYSIEEGVESNYHAVFIERCHLGNCDPRQRPKKPIGLCM